MKGRNIFAGLAICWLLAVLTVPTIQVMDAAPWGDATAATAAEKPAGEKVEGLRKFGRDCRQLGVNRRSIRRVYKEIAAEGIVDMTDQEAVAEAIEAEFMTKAMSNPEIDWESIDWDKLFEFIMKIIALFMSFSQDIDATQLDATPLSVTQPDVARPFSAYLAA